MSSDDISEEAVYLCTGNPLPQDIEQVAHWLLNETFADAFDSAPLQLPPIPASFAALGCRKSFDQLPRKQDYQSRSFCSCNLASSN